MQEADKDTQEFKKIRNKSQNTCKKYHTIAQKVFKKLGFKSILKVIGKINYRLDYFVDDFQNTFET